MKDHTIITENTQIRLGLLIAILGVCLSGVFTGVWWTASWTSRVQVKLDAILVEQKVAANQVQVLQNQLFELRKDFELHKASTEPMFHK